MKKYLFLLLSLYSIIVFSQEYNADNTVPENGELQLPVVMPPAPTAFQMTQYGDVAVNESAGLINPSVPLFTYKAGDLQVPITMSYSGGGVSVDQAPGWTGTNWSLSAGGIITRTVRNLPDERSAITRKAYSTTDLYNLNYYDEADYLEIIHYCQHISNNIDSEVDIFNYQIPGYSGSFYLDENFNAVLIKKEYDLSIEVTKNGEDLSFVIRIAGGITYHFPSNLTDESKSYNTVNSEDPSGASRYAVTAWHMSEISNEHANNHIYFEYTDQIENMMRIARSEVYSIQINVNGSGCGTQDLSSVKRQFLLQKVKERFLTKITSNRSDFDVVFYKQTKNKMYHYYTALEGIKVFNSEADDSDPSLNYFDFVYTYFDTRFFLNSIKKYTNGNFEHEYTFKYNQENTLPDRFSFRQDHWGYFNNKPNFSTLLPIVDDPVFHNVGTADRSMVFDYAKRGILTDIYYPTKGHSHFIFESSKNYSITTHPQAPVKNLELRYYNDIPQGETNNFYAESLIGPFPTIQGEPEPPITQNVKAKLIINRSGDIIHHSFVQVRIKKYLTDIEVFNKRFSMEINNQEDIPLLIKPINFDIEEGEKYHVELFFYEKNCQTNTCSENCEACIQNTGGINSIKVNLIYQLDLEGEIPLEDGIRIKSITNYDDDESTLLSYKRYYYKSLLDVVFNAPEINTTSFLPQYTNGQRIEVSCNGGSSCEVHELRVIHSSSINSIFKNSSGRRAYDYVTLSYGDDYFLGGGEQNKYSIKNSSSPYSYFGGTDYYNIGNATENQSDNNGLLKNKIFFSKKGSNYYKIKTIDYNYDISTAKSVLNNSRMLLFKKCNNDIGVMDNVYVGLYETFSYNHDLLSQTTRNYINDISMFSIDETTEDYIEETLSYQYHAPALPSQITKTDSQGNELKTNIDYSFFSIPKEKKYYINDALTKKVKTTLDFGLLPTKIAVLKKFSVEPSIIGFDDRIVFHQYGDHNTLLEVSKKDGSHIYYIWGYGDTQPIAKIENFTHNDALGIIDLINEAKIASDADDDRSLHEGILRDKLKAIQDHEALLNSSMTYYTYDPMIGITSVTDPRGQTQYYHYNNLNRLQYVLDAKGKVLSKNEYHYKK